MSQLLQYILSFIGLLAVISYGYGQVRRGRNDSRIDTINLLEKDVVILKDEVSKLSKEVTDLKIVIKEKDDKLAEALSILQGRDPQMQEFIKLMAAYIETNKPILEEIKVEVIPIVKKLDLFLNKQTF